MKAAELREMNTQELQSKLKDLKQELYSLRFNHATGQLTNPKLLNMCKKDIARVLTVMRQRELNGQKAAPAQAEVPKAK